MSLFLRKGSAKILILWVFLLLAVIIFFISQSSSKWLFEDIQPEEKLDTEIIVSEDSTTTTKLKILSFT